MRRPSSSAAAVSLCLIALLGSGTGVSAAAGNDASPVAGAGRVSLEAATVTWRDGRPAGFTGDQQLSNDGRTVLFHSNAKTLLPDPPDFGFHIYVRNVARDTTRVVTATSDGTQTPGSSWNGMGLSGDGRFAAFGWNAPELSPTGTHPNRYAYVKNLRTGRLDAIRVRGSGPTASYRMIGVNVLAISRHGRYLSGSASFDTEPLVSVVPYLFDRRTDRFRWLSPLGGFRLLSVSTAGEVANAFSGGQDISSDGQSIQFYSVASNLVSGDRRGADHTDAFVATMSLTSPQCRSTTCPLPSAFPIMGLSLQCVFACCPERRYETVRTSSPESVLGVAFIGSTVPNLPTPLSKSEEGGSGSSAGGC